MTKNKVSKVVLSMMIGGAGLLISPHEAKSSIDKDEIIPSFDLYDYGYEQEKLEQIKLEGEKLQQYRIALEEYEQEMTQRAEEERLRLIEEERLAKLEEARIKREEEQRRIETARIAEEQRKIAEAQAAEAKCKAEQQKQQQATQQVASSNAKTMTLHATYYTPYCYGCSGITATGIDVRSTIYYQGYRVIAVDPKYIPLWSIVELRTPSGTFTAIALDTGGAIKGNKIDILVGDTATAKQLGCHNVEAKVIRWGK